MMASRAFYAVPALERFFSRKLGTPIRLGIEICQEAKEIKDHWELRRRAHGAGRVILGKMMFRAKQGNVFRARQLQFPQRVYSISHCAETIVCATAGDRRVGGLGVDVEFERDIPRCAGRLYLSSRERRSLEARSAYSSANLLRLWTVKEALFKSDIENRRLGWLSGYECFDPCRFSGKARLLARPGDRRFRFASVQFQSGFLTLAISDKRRIR